MQGMKKVAVVIIVIVIIAAGIWFFSFFEKETEFSAFLKSLERTSGIEFSDAFPIEFNWIALSENGYEEKNVVGEWFSSSDVSEEKTGEIAGFFEKEGFQKDPHNVAAGTVSELSGYSKSNIVCIVIAGFAGYKESDGQWVPDQTDKKDIDVMCGELE